MAFQITFLLFPSHSILLFVFGSFVDALLDAFLDHLIGGIVGSLKGGLVGGGSGGLAEFGGLVHRGLTASQVWGSDKARGKAQEVG